MIPNYLVFYAPISARFGFSSKSRLGPAGIMVFGV